MVYRCTRMRRRLLWIALACVGLFLLLAAWVAIGLPPRSAVAELARKNPGKTRLMLQREAEAVAKGRKPRTVVIWVPLSHVSRHLIHAVLSAEDQNFFGHEGVDWDAIQKSLEKDVEKRRFARGGSTITQQLAKNLYFGTRKTIVRKLRELIVSRWLETDLSKARILALYLNVIEWGDGIYGCEAAARHWYGKSAAALTASEAAGLAAMIPNPRSLNPRASPARHARATRRVLWLMGVAGYLGRDAAGLGAEPPPEEPIEEDEEPPEEEASPQGPAAPSTPAVAEPQPGEAPPASPAAPTDGAPGPPVPSSELSGSPSPPASVPPPEP
jgi:monofunctional biosynthetic peptidoglycan transglycosylase